MTCKEFKKVGRGRPGLNLPCSICGVIWKEHIEKSKVQNIVPLIPQRDLEQKKDIKEDIKKDIKEEIVSSRRAVRRPTPSSIVTLLDCLISVNGNLV